MNNELITVVEKDNVQTVSARELHEKLEIATSFKDWFPRICEYGFEEGKDFNSLKNELVRIEGTREVKRELIDYAITVEMAKQVCMLQRSEKGKQYREYFLKLEQAWNSPEMVMQRAIQIANKQVEEMKNRLFEVQPKVEVYERISDSSTLQDLQTVAKIINLKNIFKVLTGDRVIAKCFTEDGVAYFKHYAAYEQYFELKEKPFTYPDGKQSVRPRLFVTGKGVAWLSKKYGKGGDE